MVFFAKEKRPIEWAFIGKFPGLFLAAKCFQAKKANCCTTIAKPFVRTFPACECHIQFCRPTDFVGSFLVAIALDEIPSGHFFISESIVKVMTSMLFDAV